MRHARPASEPLPKSLALVSIKASARLRSSFFASNTMPLRTQSAKRLVSHLALGTASLLDHCAKDLPNLRSLSGRKIMWVLDDCDSSVRQWNL